MNIDLADTKYNKPTSATPKKSRDFLKTILILSLLGALLWLGLLFFQKITLEKENESTKLSIQNTTKSIQELINSDNPAKKIAVAKIIKKVKEKRVLWSGVMAKIIKLEIPGISFQDFSSTSDGDIQAILSAKNFNSIQQFIAKLNTNKDVKKIVISSLQSSDSPGENSLKVEINFNLNI